MLAGGCLCRAWDYGYFFLPPVGTGSGAGTTQSSGGKCDAPKIRRFGREVNTDLGFAT